MRVKWMMSASLVAALASHAAAQQRLTAEQMKALDIWVETFEVSIACDFQQTNAAERMWDSGDLNDAGEAAADYLAMRWEQEETARRSARKAEYCATGWWKYGANGTVAAGLLTRPPPIAEQPALTAEQERILTANVAAPRYAIACRDVESDEDGRSRAIASANLPYGFGENSLAGGFMLQQMEIEIDTMRIAMQDGSVEAYCATGWARFGPEGTDVPGMLRRRE